MFFQNVSYQHPTNFGPRGKGRHNVSRMTSFTFLHEDNVNSMLCTVSLPIKKGTCPLRKKITLHADNLCFGVLCVRVDLYIESELEGKKVCGGNQGQSF